MVPLLGPLHLQMVQSERHAGDLRLAAARRASGRRRPVPESQGSRTRAGDAMRSAGRAGPGRLENSAAAWLEQLTPTDKLLQTVMDNWRDPVDVKTAFQGWNGARIVPQGRWQRPDALRCWAAGWASQGTDVSDPFVKTASVLGHVDEATGRRIVRMMLASGAKPDLADRTVTLPREAARRSGASQGPFKRLEPPSPSNSGRPAAAPRGNVLLMSISRAS